MSMWILLDGIIRSGLFGVQTIDKDKKFWPPEQMSIIDLISNFDPTGENFSINESMLLNSHLFFPPPFT